MEDGHRDNINLSAAHSQHGGWKKVAADAWVSQDRSTSKPGNEATAADTNFAQLDAAYNVLKHKFGILDNNGNDYISQKELQHGASNPNFSPSEQSALRFAIAHYDKLRCLDDTDPNKQMLGISKRDLSLLNHVLHPMGVTDPFIDGVNGDALSGSATGATLGFGPGMTKI